MSSPDANAANGAAVPVLVDTHCHLDDPAFDLDRVEVLAASERAGVLGWVNIGFSPERWTSTVQLAHQTAGMLHALGVHPQHAGDWSPSLKGALRTLLQTSGAVAVGEIGLDYFRGTQDRKTQRRVFAEQLDLSLELGMGVIIHQRVAEEDMIAMLTEFPRDHPVLLHSFDAGENLAALAVERQYFVGVGGLASRPMNGELRHHLMTFSLDRIVLESDAPYLVPHGVAARRNTPATVAKVAEFLAGQRGLSIDDVGARTNASASTFFGAELLANTASAS